MLLPDDAMPLIEFAAKLCVVPHTVRRWARDGLRSKTVRLKTVRKGGRVFVSWADYLDFQRRNDKWTTPKVEPTPKGRARDIARCMAELLR